MLVKMGFSHKYMRYIVFGSLGGIDSHKKFPKTTSGEGIKGRRTYKLAMNSNQGSSTLENTYQSCLLIQISFLPSNLANSFGKDDLLSVSPSSRINSRALLMTFSSINLSGLAMVVILLYIVIFRAWFIFNFKKKLKK